MPLIVETFDDTERLSLALDALRSRRVDAVVITVARTADTEAILQVAHGGMQIVLAVRHLPGSGLPTVVHDGQHHTLHPLGLLQGRTTPES